jgi:hypothetical protein
MKKINRRRMFQSLALTAGCGGAAEGAESSPSLEVLRNVSAFHGTNLSDDRLRILKPVLERRQADLQALREFAFDDATTPTEGILDQHG